MPNISLAAGDLRERLDVLSLTVSSAAMTWDSIRTVWGNVQPAGQSVFSRQGISAPGVQIVLRRQSLTLMQALRWRGKHVFITDCQPYGHGHLLVTGALVDLAECIADVNKTDGGFKFPAVLTEKYLSHNQLEPYAINVLTYVLVTPKAVELTRGYLTEVNGVPYEVQLAHVLDSTKNEYELVRKEDL